MACCGNASNTGRGLKWDYFATVTRLITPFGSLIEKGQGMTVVWHKWTIGH